MTYVKDTRTLTLAGGLAVLQAAIAEAERIGQPMCISVVDTGGNLLAFGRMDGSKALSVISTRNKAVTSALSNEPTGGAHADVELQVTLAQENKWTNLVGGLPIRVDGFVLGAVAAGSGTGTQDLAVARAGAAAIPGADMFLDFKPMGAEDTGIIRDRIRRRFMDDATPSMSAWADPLPSAIELARRIAVGETSALAAVETSLARIAALDDALCAFCTVTVNHARREAQAVDRRIAAGEAVGPLAGVPFAVKDLISTSGVRTTFGSPLYADNVPDEDDIVVERLRAAGAIVVGKTNTSEFGYGPVGHNRLFPPTRNPWNTELTPGGSSAGSAVAVATGMVPLALGSDGGGSIRIPAGLNGIFGIKPSWGRVPVYPGCRDETAPGASGWEALEHIGPLTRTVTDAALALSILSGPSPKDRHSLPREQIDWLDLRPPLRAGLRIAFSADLGFAHVDSEVAAIAAGAAQVFVAELGCVVDDAFPEVGDTQATFEALVALDTDRVGLRTMADDQGFSFGGALGALLRQQWTGDDFTTAIMDRKRIANVMWRFMERYDLLLTPTSAVSAFPLNLDGPALIAGHPVLPSAWTPFSALANLTGQPAASLPAGFTRDGRPVGLQIIGRHQDDIGVLRAAAAFERIRPWHDTWPVPGERRRLA